MTSKKSMDKNHVIYIHNRILLNHEKGEYPAVSDNINFEHIMVREIKKAEKDKHKYCMISFICGI